jgi:hypothetical protein
MKKINFNWPSVVLGVVLCLALLALLSVVPRMNAQTMGGAQKTEARTGMLQKMVTLDQVLDKCELIDQRILILEGKINEVQKRADQTLELLQRLWAR